MAWWAELIDRDLETARYGHRELTCDPETGALVRLAGGRSGTLTTDPAWEVQGRLGIPVPGTIVRMRDGCDGQLYHFDGPALDYIVECLEDSPSVTLEAGAAYLARLTIPELSADEPGDQVLTGAWEDGPGCLLLDLTATAPLRAGARYPARLVGPAEGQDVYAVRPDPVPGGGSTCADCVVVATSDDDPLVLPESGTLGVLYLWYSTGGATRASVRWIVLEGLWSGWWDTCTCDWVPWWCVLGDCVQYLTDPGAAGGPYYSPLACATDCEGLAPWW